MTTSSNSPVAGGPSPFTPTEGVDSGSFSSIFATKSDDIGPSPTDSSIPPAMSSFIESVADGSPTRGPPPGFPFGTATADSRTATTGTSTSATSNSNGSSIGSSTTITFPTTTTQQATSATVATSAAANSASADELHQASAMSKPGIQAAIAVPVILFALALLAIMFCCIRRRRKRTSAAEDIAEKQPPEGATKKKWTRHLRVFSFDNELLMGGRYSSTNSIRSRQTGSLRSATRSQAETPSVASIHSVEEEVAPPYRDAVHAPHPSISQVMSGAALGTAAAGVSRSTSNATAPPPYAGGARPNTARGTETRTRNPFLDTPPISPIDDARSPFNDPPGTTPALSRNSSLYQDSRDDVSSIAGASDAASIREATLARNASVRQGGRVIQNVREGSN